MIKLINQVNLPSVNFADGFSVTKIKANIFAYGCEHSFLNLWYQLGYNEEITALIERFENNLFIVTKENADFKEIKEFVFTIGFSTIQAKPEIINNLGLNFKEYQVLEYVAEGKSSLPPYPDIKKVYSLLYGEENENIKPTDFEGFYVDLSHKIRKGFAAAITTSNAVCVASHITEDSAVISGVAVQSNNQKSGLGSNILKEMSASLSGRKIFVAAENSVVPFYIKNGFLKAYKIAIYENEEN
jgi:hypothetical protein